MSYKYTPPVSLSRQERRYNSIKEEVLGSKRSLLSESTDALDAVLKTHFPEISFVVLLGHVPEQGVDIYHILIDSKRLATIEIPHLGNTTEEVLVEIETVDRYRKNIPLQLKIALEFLQDQSMSDELAEK